MITAGDFKKGITIEWDGGVWNIVDFQHVKPGKGAALCAHQDQEHHDRRGGGAQLQPHRQNAPRHRGDQGNAVRLQ